MQRLDTKSLKCLILSPPTKIALMSRDFGTLLKHFEPQELRYVRTIQLYDILLRHVKIVICDDKNACSGRALR